MTGTLFDQLHQLKDEAKVKRTTTPATSSSTFDGEGPGTAYGIAGLTGEVATLAGTQEGSRDDAANIAALKLGRLVASGQLSADAVRDALNTVVAEWDYPNGDPFGGTDVERWMRSGFVKGMSEPREVPAASPMGEAVQNRTTAKPSAGAVRGRLTRASSITPKAVRWAWLEGAYGRIPAASLTLAAGREGTGKSSFGLWLAAGITRGTLPGIFEGTPREVLYVATEDSWQYTLVPRLMAAGADCDLISRYDVVTDEGTDDHERKVTLSLPDHLAVLEADIVANSIAAVIIDPLLSVMGDGIDTHRNREVRSALEPLGDVAERTGALMLGIAHFNKSGGSDAASLITGSGAFKDVPRALLGFARDDEGRVMSQIKNSLGRDDLPSLAYAITSTFVDIPGEPVPTDVGRFDFVGESTRTVAEVLRAAGREDEDDKSERDHVSRWLTEYLTANGGEVARKDMGLLHRSVTVVRPPGWRSGS